MIDTYVTLDKVFFITGIYIHIALRVAVNQWKPGALNLYHQAMSFFETMSDRRQFKFHLLNFPWCEWLRIFITLAVTSTKNFPANQHLVTTHRVFFFRIFFSINVNIII